MPGNIKLHDCKNEQIDIHEIELARLRLRLRTTEQRLDGLISFCEYVASNLDIAIDYSEFLAGTISDHWYSEKLGNFAGFPKPTPPNFDEFKEFKERQAE
jgi:hypothetical protein